MELGCLSGEMQQRLQFSTSQRSTLKICATTAGNAPTCEVDMRGSPIIYDGLWRCLCPGLDKLALRRALAVNSLPSRRRPLAARDVARRTAPQSRLACLQPAGKRLMTTQSCPDTDSFPPPAPAPPHNTSNTSNSCHEPLLTPTPPTEEALRQASLHDIVAALLKMRQPQGWNSNGQEIDRHSRIMLLIRHLLSERCEPPCHFIYECVMDAMAYPQGSVKGIRKLFEDMASLNLKPTSEMCQSALAALTNHPDYVLRQEVLDTMEDYWIDIDTAAKQSLVLGLLREEQYELAYLRLTDMLDQKIRIAPWVYDIFIVVFGKLGFLDEMLSLLYRRKSLVNEDKDIAAILYYALDVCSQAFHYPGTIFAWNCLVRTSLVQPSDGVVENVLATAARHGDATLATEALDKISQRTRLLAHHFEAVVEAFAADGDMAAAFRALCVMSKNGNPIVRGNTRALYAALVQHPTLIQDAEESLRSIASPEQPVPLAAVGVMVEALAETRRIEAAMDLYRDVPRLCGEPANSAMMLALILHSRDTDVTRSLVRDYKAHVAANGDAGDDLPQRPHVCKAMVIACAEANELDLAFQFAHQAVEGVGADPNKEEASAGQHDLSWLKVLLGKATEVEDARIWTILDKLGSQDEATDRELTKMLRQARVMRRAANLGGK
ncbi:hypothetical protein E4U55_005277 [Claviceps digitariae]|nr:hypothetical protein E4U55_005277 [Claviceps digitariae]